MPLKGHELGADLSDLKIIAVVDLPAMQYTYAAANNAVAETSDYDAAAFIVPDGGGMCEAYEAWADLRLELQNVLGQTSRNLGAAASAMNHVVAAYAASDSSAKAALDGAWQNGAPTHALEQEERQPPPGASMRVVTHTDALDPSKVD